MMILSFHLALAPPSTAKAPFVFTAIRKSYPSSSSYLMSTASAYWNRALGHFACPSSELSEYLRVRLIWMIRLPAR
jgi:hypothetical protein